MLGDKVAEFAIRHPWITLMIVTAIGDSVSKTAYILRTGERPSDFSVRFTKEPEPQEERDKHGF